MTDATGQAGKVPEGLQQMQTRGKCDQSVPASSRSCSHRDQHAASSAEARCGFVSIESPINVVSIW